MQAWRRLGRQSTPATSLIGLNLAQHMAKPDMPTRRQLTASAATALVMACAGRPVRADTSVAIQLYNPLLPHYSQRTTRFSDRTIRSRFYHSPGKSREEMELGRRKLVLILDLHLNTAWLFGTSQELVIEAPLIHARHMFTVIPDDIAEFARIGSGMIAGIPAQIYSYRAASGSGRIWASEEGVLLKSDGLTYSKRQASAIPYTLRIHRLEVGLQPDHLFQPPEKSERLIVGGGSLKGFNIANMVDMFRIR